MREEWRKIVTSLLLGVERQPTQQPSANEAENAAQEMGRLHAAERELLSTAGAINLRRRTGMKPLRLPLPITSPALSEDQPRCGDASGGPLRMMLSGDHEENLPEFLHLIGEHGLRVAEEFLPSLLEYGATHPHLRESIARVTGKRGIWLAAYNPTWNYAAALGDDEEAGNEIWETGTIELRVLRLRAVRKRDPIRALEMLQEVWSREPAEHRSRLLWTLLENLSMADEPFLEEGLDDPDKNVAAAAAELLSRLPDSRFVERMKERGRAMLRRHQNLLKNRIEVTPPEPDEGMKRDGVDVPVPSFIPGLEVWTSSTKGVPTEPLRGESAPYTTGTTGHIIKILSAIPPEFWEAEWGKTPEQIIRTAKGEWAQAMITGWIYAVRSHGSESWSAALFNADIVREKGLSREEIDIIFLFLAQSQKEETALQYLREYRPRSDHPPDRHPNRDRRNRIDLIRPWSAALTRNVLEAFRQTLAGEEDDLDIHFAFPSWVAGNMPSELMEEVMEQLSDMLRISEEQSWNAWYLRQAADNARFRHDMHKAILNA